jgi:hypothetical protein
LLSLAQSFTALQTFSAGLTVSAGTTTISGGATFTTTVSTFNSGILRIGNATNTQFYTIVGAAIVAARQLNLPLITATDTFAVLGLAQTFSAAQTFGAGITISAGFNIAFGTTGVGGQIGTTTSQLIGFHGTAGTIQRASAAQAAVATTTATQTTPWGFTTQAQADGIVTLVNEIRTVLVNKGLMKGSA